jgi:hypothetical protein
MQDRHTLGSGRFAVGRSVWAASERCGAIDRLLCHLGLAVDQLAAMPPSTVIVWPVKKPAHSYAA